MPKVKIDKPKNTFGLGDTVDCINIRALPGNEVAPPLSFKPYRVVGSHICECGQDHVDVGLRSSYNYVSCYNCNREIPDGDKIHWCHPTRFKATNAVMQEEEQTENKEQPKENDNEETSKNYGPSL